MLSAAAADSECYRRFSHVSWSVESCGERSRSGPRPESAAGRRRRCVVSSFANRDSGGRRRLLRSREAAGLRRKPQSSTKQPYFCTEMMRSSYSSPRCCSKTARFFKRLVRARTPSARRSVSSFPAQFPPDASTNRRAASMPTTGWDVRRAGAWDSRAPMSGFMEITVGISAMGRMEWVYRRSTRRSGLGVGGIAACLRERSMSKRGMRLPGLPESFWTRR